MTAFPWSEVFAVANEQKKKLRKENPNLGVAEATKKAWKTKEVLAARAKFDAAKLEANKKAKATKKK